MSDVTVDKMLPDLPTDLINQVHSCTGIELKQKEYAHLPIAVLIGPDTYYSPIDSSLPINKDMWAFKSKFGWFINGHFTKYDWIDPQAETRHALISNSSFGVEDEDVENDLRIEETDLLTPLEREFIKNYRNENIRLVDNRYIVRFPRIPQAKVSDNLCLANARLKSNDQEISKYIKMGSLR